MNRRRSIRPLAIAALALGLSGCAAIPVPAPVAPPPAVTATPPPVVVTAPVRPWDERALDSGAWRYDAARRAATFEQAGSATPLLSIMCSAAQRSIILTTGTQRTAAPAWLKTTAGTDAITFTGTSAVLAASDVRLDRIAFSRGRFALEGADGSGLTLPVQSEIGRVIEDCRG